MDYRVDKSKLKVALVQCPAWGASDPPIALALLSSCLKQRGYKVKVFDINIGLYNSRKDEFKTVWAMEQNNFWFNKNNVTDFFSGNRKGIEKYINKILYFNPDVIGFSVSITSLLSTLEFAKKMKEINPKIKIVIGGQMFFVPTDIKSIFQSGCVDIIVFGEGEETFCQLLEVLEKKNLKLCKGIYFKQNGRIVKTKPRPLLKNLDELPFLDFTDLPFDEYDPLDHIGKQIPLMTSRGCPLGCVFCASKIYWPGYRTMSGKRIYDELKYHIEKNPDVGHVRFMDLLFNGNVKTLVEFCDLMISNPVKRDLRWHAFAIIRSEMTLEILQKMKRAGCEHLIFGIESGSQHVLDLMKKQYKIEDADRVLRFTHEAGIQVTCIFMLGFPGETEEDFEKTLDFLKRNAKYMDFAYPSRAFCTIEPHTYLEKHMEEFGIVPNPKINTYWESKDGTNTYPERLRRCEVFSEFASSIGLSVCLGLQTSIELDKWYNLGQYYESKNDYRKAVIYFLKYLQLDPGNRVISDKVDRLNNFRSVLSQ